MPATRKFRRRVNIGLLAMAFVLIMLTSFVSVSSTSALGESMARVAHTRSVKDMLLEMQVALFAAQSTGMRYMISGQGDYMMEHRAHLRRIDDLIKQLGDATADNPRQQENLSKLIIAFDALVERSRDSLKLKLQAIEAHDERAPLSRLRDGAGVPIANAVLDQILVMTQEEDSLLLVRTRERDALVKQTNATVLIANSLALVAGVLGFVALRRAQRESENNLLVELRAAQARRASEEKSAFLANMSHEIRTPMNAIFGFTQLLSDSVTEPVQRDWVQSIKKSGDVLLGLINDVLDLSKIEAGKLQLNLVGTDIAELVGETLDLFAPLAAEKGLFLSREIDRENLVPVVVDAQRLRQVLMNLVSNAVKYTESGGVVVRVSTTPSVMTEGRDLRLIVSDSGVGIDPDQQAKIFEPFHQADSPDGKVRPGTGLGLSITRRLVDVMKGRIHVDSHLGKGSTFLVEIPALAEAPPATSPAADSRTVDFNRLPPLKVLIVDDVAWNAEVAKGYLRDSHHDVFVASDGLEGVNAAKALQPDVVLMDLRMPRMSGYEARDAIRADATLARTAIIAITASSLGGEEAALRASFDGYVRKPYVPAELFSALQAIFGARDAATPATAAAPEAEEFSLPAHLDAAALARWRALRGEPLQALRRGMRMREIARYASTLATLAVELDYPVLATRAQALAKAVDLFDVVAVKLLLDELADWPEDRIRGG
ncbi:ATP-binding protein [Arenimonas oryziterrae]|uniref:Sensory/regulatory protein RpfC n=1 Tax=Arenimonas oryziterrae DSM 21050 = YC6267 TaxID=1121015 RepID=A0A091AWT7_9GAMM|nr:ATP-binding protein [Arenimonas oryziterrae]KFN43881.1 hypothetical protein N789_08005 [Arenimonas oryziterrae DSM 21050 = YC6267]